MVNAQIEKEIIVAVVMEMVSAIKIAIVTSAMQKISKTLIQEMQMLSIVLVHLRIRKKIAISLSRHTKLKLQDLHI